MSNTQDAKVKQYTLLLDNFTGFPSPLHRQMPAVTRDQEDSESSSEDEHEGLSCIAWSGASKKIPILLFFPEAIVSKDDKICSIGDRYKMAFKIVRTESRLVRGLLTNHGFHEVHPNSNDFNLMWTGSHLKPYILRSLQDFQKVNHFPRSYELTRKDRLYKNIQRMQQAHGFKNFHIVPQTFVLPSEYQEFCSCFAKDKGPWIIKPVASSRGRGIYLVSNPNQISMDENILVSRYIHNPLLIDDFKFDMRLYVLVTSYDPLLIYVYEEGLARFATVKYDRTSKNIKNNFMHLTNYSVNKKSCDYVSCDDPEVEDYGNKWSVSAVLRYLKQEGKDTTLLMRQVEDLIIKALLSAEPQISAACKMFVPYKTNCFELYGFDVLIDAKLKPWLLEVNLSPSLACDAPLDLKIKASMIADMFSLVGLMCQDPLSRQPRSERATLDPSLKHLTPRMQRRQKAAPQSVEEKPHSSSSNSETDRGMKGEGDSTLNLTAEEVKVLRRIKEEYERRGGFIRIFPTAETWECYSGYLESKTSLNSMLAHRLFHGRTVQLQVDVLRGSHLVQYERKLQSLEARKRHLHHRSHCSSKRKSGKESKGFPTESRSQDRLKVNGQCESSTHMVGDYSGQVVTALSLDGLHTEAVSSSERAPWDSQPKVNLLHILQQGLDLSKVQARLAFSSYLQRVQQRLLAESRANTIPAWPDKDNDQMELVIRFLKRAASNLQQGMKVGLPSRQLPLQDRRRILSQQLGEFIQHYNKETDHVVKKQESREEERCVNHIVFQEYISGASENDLEEVLTYYTQRNKSAAIFLGSKVCSLNKEVSTENVSGEPGNCGDSRTQPFAKDDSSTSESSLSAEKVSSDPDIKVSVNQLSDQPTAANCGTNTLPGVQAFQHRSNVPANLDCSYIHPSSSLPLHCPPPPPPQQPPSYTQSLAKSQFCQADTDPPAYTSSPVPTQPRLWRAAPNTATSGPSTQGLRRATSFTSPMPTSSFPSATHIYSQKLSRPTSAGQVVMKSSSSKLKSNSVGTFKELNALSAQAQSNQQAFITALQRLSDKQVVRQYASSNHINLLTQHLSNLNLANNVLKKGSLMLSPKAWHAAAPTAAPVKAFHSGPELNTNKRPLKDDEDVWASPFQRAYSVVTGVSPQHSYHATQGSYQLQYAIQQLQQQRLKSQQLLERSQSRHQDQSSNQTSVQTSARSSSCPSASLRSCSHPSAVSLIQTNACPVHVPKPPRSGRSEGQGRKTTATHLLKPSSAETSTTGPISNGKKIVYEAICGESGLSMYRKVFPGQKPSHR